MTTTDPRAHARARRRTRPLRVLEIANGLRPELGGPTVNAVEMHAAFNRRDDVLSHLISARGDGAAVAPPSTGAAPTGPSNPVVRILKLLATCDVVVIHGYYVWWSPAVTVLSRLLGRSVAVIPHGSLTRRQRRFSRGRKTVWELLPGALVRGAADAFVVQSDMERVELLEAFPHLAVVVGGIGTPLPPLDDRPRRTPGDGDAAPVRLLSLSRIAPKKRIDLMIDAVAELARRGVAARLVVAGTGSAQLEQELRAQAARSGVADAVEFAGMLAGEAKEAAFADAQLFLAPSDDENFGISPAEALARGLPCIGSTSVASLTGLPATAGAVLDAPTAAAIADAVQRLLGEDPEALRRGARAFAEATYDWDVVAERWARLLRTVRSGTA